MTNQTQEPSEKGILDALDERPATAFYYRLALLATLGGFLFGYDTSDIGSALNFVPYDLHGLALGYLVSGASLGAAAGAILAGPVADRFGRKWLLIVDAGIYALGAILSAVTVDAAMLLASRTLIGLVLRAGMPESPRWLLRHGRYDQARAAFATLGVTGVTDDDARRAAALVVRAEATGRTTRSGPTRWRRDWTPGARHAG